MKYLVLSVDTHQLHIILTTFSTFLIHRMGQHHTINRWASREYGHQRDLLLPFSLPSLASSASTLVSKDSIKSAIWLAKYEAKRTNNEMLQLKDMMVLFHSFFFYFLMCVFLLGNIFQNICLDIIMNINFQII